MMTDKRGWSPAVFKPQRLYDLIIAPANATDSAKSYADVILPGAADEVVLNQVLADYYATLSTPQYITIGILGGTIYIKSPIIIPKYFNLKGIDILNKPRIKVDSTYTTGFSMISKASNDTTTVYLENIYIYASSSTNVYYNDVVPLNNVNRGALLNNVSLYSSTITLNQVGGYFYATNLIIGGNNKTNVGSIGANFSGCSRISITNYDMNQNVYAVSNVETGMKFDSGCAMVYLNGIYFSPDSLVNSIDNASPNLINEGCFVKAGTARFRNKGQSAIAQGATSIVVTHNLLATPNLQDFQIIPNASCTWWISNITSTQFTINIASAAPTGGITFGWHCKLY